QGNLLDGVVLRLATQEENDALTVTTAKTALEGAAYAMTQAAATNEAAVKAAIEAKIATLALDGVTATVSEVLYTPAIAGDAATPSGTNGTYTFTIDLLKGAATATTVTLTMTVMATTYVAPVNVEITGFDAISNLNAGTAGSATYGNAAAVIAALPTSATANASAVTVPVTTWIDTDSYNPAVAGSYTFTATLGAIPTGFANIGGYTATVEVTVAPYITPAPSTPSNNTGNVDKNIGQIIKDQQLDKSVPNTNVNNSTEDLKSAVFTTEELAKIEAGEDAKVILKVTDINNSVSESDKKLITKNLDEGTSLMYIDLSLYKKVGDGTETKITETKNKISISIEIPAELRSTDMEKNRTYKIVRIHDGVVTMMEGTYDPVTYLFTFETDRFSTYALAYKDANVGTDSSINDEIITNDFFPLRLTAEAAETSQKLTYTKVPDADGYIIYGSPCGINNKMIKLADVSGKTTSYSNKGLKKAKYYKYYVQAYRIINGKKVVIATSKVIHSVTTSKTYANPTKVVSDTSAVILTVGTSQKVTCKVVLPSSKKMDNHASVLRYETTNKAIATVTQSGKIKAVSEGTCYIYAYAQNGVYTKIIVTVK
ncbi:MAG: Ig-like domain-containing protein, partial [Mobilitalea sp.]